jgi:HSP20 family molecular chaperone IbpA
MLLELAIAADHISSKGGGAIRVSVFPRRSEEDRKMTRMTPFSNPMLLGFDSIEKTLERLCKSGDSYPPYNIERIRTGADAAPMLRITLAVAGFAEADLDISTEDNQLVVRGRQAEDDGERDFLHRGIAARQFQKVFLLADGMRVTGAELCNGLLAIELERPEPERLVRKINISVRD